MCESGSFSLKQPPSLLLLPKLMKRAARTNIFQLPRYPIVAAKPEPVKVVRRVRRPAVPRIRHVPAPKPVLHKHSSLASQRSQLPKPLPQIRSNLSHQPKPGTSVVNTHLFSANGPPPSAAMSSILAKKSHTSSLHSAIGEQKSSMRSAPDLIVTQHSTIGAKASQHESVGKLRSSRTSGKTTVQEPTEAVENESKGSKTTITTGKTLRSSRTTNK